jgi:hypothetical protein
MRGQLQNDHQCLHDQFAELCAYWPPRLMCLRRLVCTQYTTSCVHCEQLCMIVQQWQRVIGFRHVAMFRFLLARNGWLLERAIQNHSKSRGCDDITAKLCISNLLMVTIGAAFDASRSRGFGGEAVYAIT